MPRKYRIVVSEKPHHVIQRGNRRQQVFFYPGDKTLYLKLLKEQVVKHNVEVRAYCLMDNHIHLVLVPKTQEGLAKAVRNKSSFYLSDQCPVWLAGLLMAGTIYQLCHG